MTSVEPTGETARIIEQQRQWAHRVGIRLDTSDDRIASLDDALFAALRDETRESLAEGKGNELTRLQSLRSSSCLVLNIFQPWFDEPSPITTVLHPTLTPLRMQLEATQPTGLRGIPPHLDVLLSGDGPSLGIESKFLEMYSPASNRFSDSYFADPHLWDGLPGCRELAARIARGETEFAWLGAAQLLKHALGLSKQQPQGFRLALLWYRVDGAIAEEIDVEIDLFR